MGEYESKLNERGKFPHRVNMDGYLRSYLYNPVYYLLSVARARQMVEAHCGPEEPQEGRLRNSYGGQRETSGREATRNTKDKKTNTQKVKRHSGNLDCLWKTLTINDLFIFVMLTSVWNHLDCVSFVTQMQQLMDLVLTCKRNAENEVNREEAAAATGGVMMAPGRKRRLEQETAERALKFLKASQEPGKHGKIPGEETRGSNAFSLEGFINRPHYFTYTNPHTSTPHSTVLFPISASVVALSKGG